MKKIITLLLALTLFAALACPAAMAGPELGYRLEKVGEKKDPGCDLDFSYDIPLYISSSNVKMLNYMGEPVVDGVRAVESLGCDLYAVSLWGNIPNSTGLFTAEGEMLIPCEAAKISWINNGEGRYLHVIYAEEETKIESECYIFATERSYTFGDPEPEDVMYTGYGLIYDVESKAFVPELVSNNGSVYAFYAVGDSVFYQNKEGAVSLYNGAGEVIFEADGYIDVSEQLFMRLSGDYIVYDENGRETYHADNSEGVELIDGEGGYIEIDYRGEDKSKVCDRYGNELFTIKDGYCISERDGLFYVKDKEVYKIVDSKGKTIVKHNESINYTACGIYYTKEGEAVTLYDENGAFVENVVLNGYIHDLLLGDEADKNIFVVNDGKFSYNMVGYVTRLGVGLAVERTDEGRSGVVDAFTGELLLPHEYKLIQKAGNYLYAYKGEKWEIYRITGPEL